MKIVTAAIIFHGGKILIAQRKHGKNQEYLWEFPGGKQEAGETLEECLHREIMEELRLDITVGKFFTESRYDYESGSISLRIFFASCSQSDISYMDSHEQVSWVLPSRLPEYNFAPADIPVVERLLKSGCFETAAD